MSAPVLAVEQLSIDTPRTSLVRDVSFSIGPGERVGLIGESGSGKSVTSMAVFGLLAEGLKASGSIRLMGVDDDLVEANEARVASLRGNRMAMVFQEPMTALNPTMKIGKQVAEAFTVHGELRRKARARALEMLETVELPDAARAMNAYPHELSGGQRQRVALAIAMANSPSLLICDEPTTALDVTVQARMLALIDAQVAESRSALLFITHDLAVVATICQKVLVMFGGELLESGPVEEVFRNPRHPYTKALLASSELDVDPATGRLATIPDDLFAYKDRRGECPRCKDRDDAPGTASSAWIETEVGGYACWHEAAASTEAAGSSEDTGSTETAGSSENTETQGGDR
ncbi:ABC transporter ATP-binding protein [Demequina sp. NBRC 110054]|uniref:ABC transporter ATP-binding protein n=1 Tax=Demequina sp. NBRC 110054 TaxID=1570343 RepID=UPI000A019702|nr:ABC transporter ATP-binding protein [Demequina sp. NBRC 110054]